MPIGTIFGVIRNTDYDKSSFIKSGRYYVSAGYSLYGPSDIFVLTINNKEVESTLEPESEQYYLTRSDIKVPKEGSIYSIISLMHSEQNITGASSYPLATYYGYNHAYCGASFLEKSIFIINKKNPYLFNPLVNELKFKNIIKEKSVNSLVQKLQSIKKEYRIENLILDENQIIKVAKQTKTMPMLKFSPVKFSLKDIKNFLSY